MKVMKNQCRYMIILLTGLAMIASSCKKYLDVNRITNAAENATVQTLLPAGQLYLGTSFGVDLQINGSILAQYWTQSPTASQYHVLDQYAAGQDFFAYPWRNLYYANINFFQLYKLADSLNNKQYKAIALLMQAYTFQAITDGWGDVPFSEALKGQYADGHIVNAKYDNQKDIYLGIIDYIKRANALLDVTDPIHPGGDDLVYGGDMEKWQRFSNTLMLRVLLRMSNVDPAASQSGIAALFADPATSIFIEEGDDASIAYGANSANKNPLYAEEVGLQGTQNLVGSSTVIDSMNSNTDLRAYVFYEYLPSTGTILGLPQGLYTNVPAGTYSIVSYNVAGDATNPESANAPVHLLTSWESLFLRAEAAARGWAPGGGDDSLYYAGIHASFTYPRYSAEIAGLFGISGEDAYYIYRYGDTSVPAPAGYWGVYPSSGSAEQRVRFIITQKWFAMCGNQGFEAWNEWRRTGYPDFFTISRSSIIGNTFPRRFLYPTSESTTDANFPGLQPITTKVWWDTRP